jgi:hypothetical protein
MLGMEITIHISILPFKTFFYKYEICVNKASI